jgi:hypothetical protein
MKKRRHHHVWQHYLKAWAMDDQICCLSNGRIFTTNTINIAQERDFYRLYDLTQADIAWASILATNKARPSTQSLHGNFLKLVLAPLMVTRDVDLPPELRKEIDLYQTNVLEDFHAKIENDFIPILRRIRAGDLSFYEDSEECILFLHFLCVQIMRTKPVKERTLELNRKTPNVPDLSRIWNLLTYMLAVNIGGTLFVERKIRKLALLRNRTEVEFITSDQPATNLLGDGRTAPEKLSIYYPVGPDLALILSEEDKEPLYASEPITAEDVMVLNAKIASASHSQIFGASEASLKATQKSQLDPIGREHTLSPSCQ